MSKLYLVMLLAGALAVLGLMQSSDDAIVKAEQARYCGMVEMYRATDGVYGWPNYDNRDCSGYGDTGAGQTGNGEPK